jgi:hypothetical protein
MRWGVEEKLWGVEVDSAQAAATLAKGYSLEELVVGRPLARRTFRRKRNLKDLSRRNVGNLHRSSQVTLKLLEEAQNAMDRTHHERPTLTSQTGGVRAIYYFRSTLGEFSTRNENQSDPT